MVDWVSLRRIAPSQYYAVSEVLDNLIRPANRTFFPKSLDKIFHELICTYWGENWVELKSHLFPRLFSSAIFRVPTTSDECVFYLAYQFPIHFNQYRLIFLDLFRKGLLNNRLSLLDVSNRLGVGGLSFIHFVLMVHHSLDLYFPRTSLPHIAIDFLTPSNSQRGLIRGILDRLFILNPVLADIISFNFIDRVSEKRYDLVIGFHDFIDSFLSSNTLVRSVSPVDEIISVLTDIFPPAITKAMVIGHSFFTNDGTLVHIPLALFSRTNKFGFCFPDDSLWSYANELEEGGWTLIEISDPVSVSIDKFTSMVGHDTIWDQINEFGPLVTDISFSEGTSSSDFSFITSYLSEGSVLIVSSIFTHLESLQKLKRTLLDIQNLELLFPCGHSQFCLQFCDSCPISRTEHLKLPLFMKKIDEIIGFTENQGHKLFSSSHSFSDYINNRIRWFFGVFVYDFQSDCDSVSLSSLSTVPRDRTLIPSLVLRVFQTLHNEDLQYFTCDPEFGLLRLSFTDNCFIRSSSFESIVEFRDVRILDLTEGHLLLGIEPQSRIVLQDDPSVHEVHYLTSPPELPTLEYFLLELFGFDCFWDGQYEVISRILQGKNVLALMPTGGGKSLCFQLSSLLLPGLTLVISPLKSLMLDQVLNLQSAGFDIAANYDSSLSDKRKKQVEFLLKAGFLKMLYIAPERLQIESFQVTLRELLLKVPLNLFVIDEAHCVSEWGHDFRPSYLLLRKYCREFGSPPIVALTATASLRVQEDVLNLLSLGKQNLIAPKPLDRPEISLEVYKISHDEDREKVLVDLLSKRIPKILGYSNLHEVHEKNAGIIFTVFARPTGRSTTPFGVEFITKRLSLMNFNVRKYHSQLDEDTRVMTQLDFRDDLFPLLVSTKGFGMGIDKENIDYVIHYVAPPSLESYYQEAGRAGRDGLHAHSIILYKPLKTQCLWYQEHNDNDDIPCGNWRCKYGESFPCDYAFQIYLRRSSFPDSMSKCIGILKDELKNILAYSTPDNEGNLIYQERDSNRKYFNEERWICRLLKGGIITDYSIINFKRVGYNKYLRTFRIKLDSSFSRKVSDSILRDIAKEVMQIRRRHYFMQKSIYNYLENTQICRRRILMDYFGQPVSPTYECGFCDICGIKSEQALKVSVTYREQSFFKQFESLLLDKTLDLKVLQLYDEGREMQLNQAVYTRSLRHLEDYPNSEIALYYSIMSSYQLGERGYSLRQLKTLKSYLLDWNPVCRKLIDQFGRFNMLAAALNRTEIFSLLLKDFEEMERSEYIAKTLSKHKHFPNYDYWNQLIHTVLISYQLKTFLSRDAPDIMKSMDTIIKTIRTNISE